MCFSAFSLSRPRWHAVRATHIPRRPKKKPLRGKKTTPIACRIKSCSWTGAGGGMAVMEPLPRKNSASCAGAIFCARTFNVLSDSGIQPGGAGAKYCAPTFNALSDCEVRRDYMAVACPYLRLVIVWGCVLNERAVKILGKFFGEKLHK